MQERSPRLLQASSTGGPNREPRSVPSSATSRMTCRGRAADRLAGRHAREELGGGVEVGDVAAVVDGDEGLAHAADDGLHAGAQPRPRRRRPRAARRSSSASDPVIESKASDRTPSSSSLCTSARDARGCRWVISPAATVRRPRPGADALADDGRQHQGERGAAAGDQEEQPEQVGPGVLDRSPSTSPSRGRAPARRRWRAPARRRGGGRRSSPSRSALARRAPGAEGQDVGRRRQGAEARRRSPVCDVRAAPSSARLGVGPERRGGPAR